MVGGHETLSWVVRVLRRRKGPEEGLRMIEDALNRVDAGSAVEFGERIGLLPED